MTLMCTTFVTAAAGIASANERLMTYTYEPETMPQGSTEFEQWVTLRAGRSEEVGEDRFNKWEFKEEFEYGVTDNYTAALYLNASSTNFEDPGTGDDTSEFEFDGVSLENRYMVWNPADHAVGLTLYLEPRYSGEEAELEEKIIIGQRAGDWKWALNLIHATEWADHLYEMEGEVDITAGLVREFNPHWAAGLEFRNHNAFPEYDEWEHTVFFLGPVVSYRQERWWATLTVLPQIFGRDLQDDEDGHRHLVLDGHERVNARLLIGIDF